MRSTGTTGRSNASPSIRGFDKLAGGGLDGTVTVWDTTNGKLLRTFEWRRSTVRMAAQRSCERCLRPGRAHC